MAAIKTAGVEKRFHMNYLTRAAECAAEMRNALKEKRWNAAAILAVHCAISSADALTVFYFEKRHAGTQHSEVLRLFRQVPEPQAIKKERQLKRLLDLKKDAEYSKRLIRETEARDAVKQAKRFLNWTMSLLSP